MQAIHDLFTFYPLLPLPLGEVPQYACWGGEGFVMPSQSASLTALPTGEPSRSNTMRNSTAAHIIAGGCAYSQTLYQLYCGLG